MENILAIVPAAWRPNNTIFPSYSNLPDCMIPINSKPVIWYILEDLVNRWISDAILLLNPRDAYTEKYVSIRYSWKFESLQIKYTESWSLVQTLYNWWNNINSTNYSWILIYLWDTIYKWNLGFDNSFITVTSKYSESSKWCFVEKNNDSYSFINKPINYNWVWKAVTWLYFFDDSQKFIEILNEIKDGEISNILQKYSESKSIELIESEWRYDCWHIDNYYRAKIDFLKIREFNWIKFNPEFWTITKSSLSKKDKIRREINRYLNVPHDLKIFSPRLINYSYWNEDTAPYYEIEYYGYQSLWDMFVFSYLSQESWKLIIDNLFSKLKIFKQYKSNQPFSFFYDMYYDKTIKRVNQLQNIPEWANLLSMDKIIINKSEYRWIPYVLGDLGKLVESLYDKDDITFIHGDFCLSNILYDINNGILKMIDPRWYFWELWVFWDHKYDIAKLRHSFVWFYDFIVSDLFEVKKIQENEFELEIYVDQIHNFIAKYFDEVIVKYWYNIEKIKLVEALLFLSMIPLHSDNKSRQLAMFCIAIQKFNEII